MAAFGAVPDPNLRFFAANIKTPHPIILSLNFGKTRKRRLACPPKKEQRWLPLLIRPETGNFKYISILPLTPQLHEVYRTLFLKCRPNPPAGSLQIALYTSDRRIMSFMQLLNN
jgi:hypothetical protein